MGKLWSEYVDECKKEGITKYWFEYMEDFRKEGRYWKDLTEKEKSLVRDAYKKRFGREMQEPRTLVERWLYEADRHPLKITEKPNKQD